jgi:hypothetical protein
MQKKSWTQPSEGTTQAMNEVVSEMTDMNIKPVMPTDDEPGGPADKQLMVRCTQPEKDLWKQAADASSETLASFVRRVLNENAQKAVSCSHPKQSVKFYPWGNPQFFCVLCSMRIDMNQIGN